MHPEAMRQWPKLLSRWGSGQPKVLDVGSYDGNGCLRPLIQTKLGWGYIGVDLVKGPNVDVVSDDPYHYPFDDESFDIVVSSSVMEHVEAIWLWIPELVRLIRPGGMLAIITHTHWKYHPHPVDTWRIMPDGMRYLFDLTEQLTNYQIEMYCDTDISATAWKVDYSE